MNQKASSSSDLFAAVEQLADEVLWPAATEVDGADRIPLGHFEAMAELGLFGMAAPPESGGLGLAAADVRQILRTLGSGCGATSFAFAQHHGTVASVASSGNGELRARALPQLVDRQLAGIAYAHVRRKGPPVLRASADSNSDSGSDSDSDGWTLTGEAPWATSWGTAEVMAVAAVTEDRKMVWALVPMVEGAGLAVAGTFSLLVYGATQTVALGFDQFHVDPSMLLNVVDIDEWAVNDRFLAARPNPLCLGVGDRALRELQRVAPALAGDLQPWWDGVGARAEQQCQAVDARSADLEAVAAARAETLMAVQRLTTALLAATGGGAMEQHNPAQRLAREALFYVIQAQSADGRQAMFDRLATETSS